MQKEIQSANNNFIKYYYVYNKSDRKNHKKNVFPSEKVLNKFQIIDSNISS